MKAPGTSSPVFGTAALREQARRLRSMQMRGLNPESLGVALDAFESGNLRQAAQYWHSMALRDDVIAAVKPKREKAVARRDWQILTSDESRKARRHQEVLEDFWSNRLTAVDALDRNDRGGIAKLIRQMMQAQSMRYAVHHLVWQVREGRLELTAEAVPLWHFENRTGELRFLETGMEYSGKELLPREWLVTVGDGLMFAGSIGYTAKRSSLADWIVFSEKFGIPGLLGKTSQGQDTPGGVAMQEAVDTFSNDWAAVLFGDDGSGKIDLIQAGGSASSLPFPALIERIDRRLAGLWRGADLSSMSSGAGEGTGASLQREEMDLIEHDDALMISETLNEIEHIVIGWHFGWGEAPLAYLRINTPQREDLRLMLDAIDKLVGMGAPVAVAEILERFGLSQPKEGEELLQARSTGRAAAAQDAPEEVVEEERLAEANAQREADEERFLARTARLLARVPAQQRQVMTEELRGVLSGPRETAVNAVAEFVARLPERLGRDSAGEAAWRRHLGGALRRGMGVSQ